MKAAKGPPSSEKKFGRGFGTLVNSGKEAGKETPPASPPLPASALPANADKIPDQTRRRELLPAWFFFCADILILIFVTCVMTNLPKPLGKTDLLFCAFAVGFACLMGLCGVLKNALD